ncbi:MAG: hypothetical protein KGM49_05945 [Sphingomonadales bacterium]|nr:hypothetical protein [Sphingomonadales bacterium]
MHRAASLFLLLLVTLQLFLPLLLHPESARGLFMWGFSAFVIVGLAALSLSILHDARTKREIQKHGQRTMADVVDIYEDSCGRHSCSIMAKYQYTAKAPGGTVQTFVGYGYLGNSRDNNDEDQSFARQNRKMPVAYNTGNPASSMPNFADGIFNVEPLASAYTITAILRGVAVVSIMILWLMLRASKPTPQPRGGMA